jgi:GTPase SAR1 family protein
MRRKDESKHCLVIGDTGVGKSTFIRQILHYAQHCGDTCVVLDSKLEFSPEFFDPRRQDRILSPKDESCDCRDF